MPLPYKVATLLYCFNERDEILLLERTQEPNRGFWSPCGGKLKMDIGESPFTYLPSGRTERLDTGKIYDLFTGALVSRKDSCHGFCF